ncbi:MAG: phosphoribosylglycinamide formyltransferase [Muribaculaceae bacterium]|nr:phosphoribosylglycinamide formyltransferase [Muribaculaceae bacterium]
MKNIAVFASGSGSNAENLIHYFNDNQRGANVKLVICNKQNAGVVERAQRLGIDCVILNKEQIQDPDTLLPVLEFLNIDVIVLAGFLLLIPQFLVDSYENRIVNIHPALLPKFGGKGMYGRHVHEAVIESGEKETGITIHYVNGHYDSGNIIFQAKVSLLPDDTVENVEAKVRELEQKYFAQVIFDTFCAK